MNDLKIFVPMTKIDAAQRLVFGVVTAERPDGSGEVCDYASTKRLYQKCTFAWCRRGLGATRLNRNLGFHCRVTAACRGRLPFAAV